MINLKGKYNSAKVFTNNVEESALQQIIELLNQDFIKESKVRIMPDVHAGSGCVIGFTANMGGVVIPNIVGVDIGCGMLTVELGKIDIDLKKLDDIINEYVPAGRNIHTNKIIEFSKIKDLYYQNLRDIDRIERSIGTLGGGNHFVEVDIDSNGNKYLVIHSGSRNLGHQVATFYQDLAIDLCNDKKDDLIKDRNNIIEIYKKQGREKEIWQALKQLEEKYSIIKPNYPNNLCYLTGKYRGMYLNDMRICQEYANLNRENIANIILNKLFKIELEDFNYFQTIHNYINFEDNIVRKGAISARKGEKVLIPINMRDGSILAVGKGNPDWNYSAPHGAGRLMSRTVAKDSIALDIFQASMKDVYTTSVKETTLDEAPMAYKPMKDIVDNIGDTVDIIDMLKPIYNFKCSK